MADPSGCKDREEVNDPVLAAVLSLPNFRFAPIQRPATGNNS